MTKKKLTKIINKYYLSYLKPISRIYPTIMSSCLALTFIT